MASLLSKGRRRARLKREREEREAAASGREEGKQNNALWGRTRSAEPRKLGRLQLVTGVLAHPVPVPQGVSAAARISSDRPRASLGVGLALGPPGLGSVGDQAEQGRQAPPPEGAIRHPATCKSLTTRRALHGNSIELLHRRDGARRCFQQPTDGAWSTLAQFWTPVWVRARWGRHPRRAPFWSRSVMLELPTELALSSRATGSRARPECGMTLFLFAIPRRARWAVREA